MTPAKTESIVRERTAQQEEYTWIGKPVKRKEDASLLKGRGDYVDNMHLPNTAHIALVRCPYPHARIVSIKTDEARRLPGVVDIITGKEIAQLTNPVLFDHLPAHQKVRPGRRQGEVPRRAGRRGGRR